MATVTEIFSSKIKKKQHHHILLPYLILLIILFLLIFTFHFFENDEVGGFGSNFKFFKTLLHQQWRLTKGINGSDHFFFETNLWRPPIPRDPSLGDDDRILDQMRWIERMSNSSFFHNLKPKKILVIDGFRAFYFHDSSDLKCPASQFASKCLLKEDKFWFFRDDLPNFDAVIGTRNWVFKIFEPRLPKTVRQILYTVESPFVTLFADFSVNNALLASYHRGSDIVTPYGKWVSFDQLEDGGQVNLTGIIKEPAKVQNDETNITVTIGRNWAAGKTKLVAIVVSDCTPDNRRLDYVRELQRYIRVDVFGKCGTLSCGPNCFEMLKKQYKFYLSFENANCVDYITENFFNNALQNDMVPIVLGARKEDYVAAAPSPNSFIFVEDFETPWHLALHLTTLDEDDEAYSAHFSWRDTGQLIFPMMNLFCRACALLHYEDFVMSTIQKPVWSPSTGSTWKKVDRCLDRGKWYWDREG